MQTRENDVKKHARTSGRVEEWSFLNYCEPLILLVLWDSEINSRWTEGTRKLLPKKFQFLDYLGCTTSTETKVLVLLISSLQYLHIYQVFICLKFRKRPCCCAKFLCTKSNQVGHSAIIRLSVYGSAYITVHNFMSFCNIYCIKLVAKAGRRYICFCLCTYSIIVVFKRSKYNFLLTTVYGYECLINKITFINYLYTFLAK